MSEIEYREMYDYAGVFVDSEGRVFRVTDSVIENGQRYVDLQEIRKYLCGNYETVRIMRKDGTMVTVNVHSLICEAFHGKPPARGLHVRHLNGDSRCNRASNLAYGTPHQNWEDKIVAKTATIGEKNHNAKLTDAERLEACDLYNKGASQRTIARRYGVTQSAVSKIIKKNRVGAISAD